MKRAIYISIGTVIGVITAVAWASWQVIQGLSETSDWGEDDDWGEDLELLVTAEGLDAIFSFLDDSEVIVPGDLFDDVEYLG